MKYVSLTKGRAPAKKAPKPSPNTSAEPAASKTNPDGGTPASKPEEG